MATLRGKGYGIRIPELLRNFFVIQNVQTGSRNHTDSYGWCKAARAL